MYITFLVWMHHAFIEHFLDHFLRRISVTKIQCLSLLFTLPNIFLHLATTRTMCFSSFFFSMKHLCSSTVLQRRFLKKTKAFHLRNSRMSSGNGKMASLKKRGHNREEEEQYMKKMNRRLYLKNKAIMKENNRLREIANFLNQENQMLQSHIQNIKKSS
ncbi:protein LITTLE ZIPPER 1 isoform X2 [Phalaenopsis equestris]|uniref:protein LITTLE ZIPPER 1 isoform X2 n=1 Tax=Phalaenopsis equestris TaxID=78828 RepID=UPI0009E29072|nr:protein LITTLE ZIPPER 1 isoform X2 [Phalaenopsis equestris]